MGIYQFTSSALENWGKLQKALPLFNFQCLNNQVIDASEM